MIKTFKSKENIYYSLLAEYEAECRVPILSPSDLPQTEDPMEKLQFVYESLEKKRFLGSKRGLLLKQALDSRITCKEKVLSAEKQIQNVAQQILLPLLKECSEKYDFPSNPVATADALWLFIIGTIYIHHSFPNAQKLSFDEIKKFIIKA